MFYQRIPTNRNPRVFKVLIVCSLSIAILLGTAFFSSAELASSNKTSAQAGLSVNSLESAVESLRLQNVAILDSNNPRAAMTSGQTILLVNGSYYSDNASSSVHSAVGQIALKGTPVILFGGNPASLKKDVG